MYARKSRTTNDDVAVGGREKDEWRWRGETRGTKEPKAESDLMTGIFFHSISSVPNKRRGW